jgi:hypothetical protein
MTISTPTTFRTPGNFPRNGVWYAARRGEEIAMGLLLLVLPAMAYAAVVAALAAGKARPRILGILVRAHIVVFAFVALSTELLSACHLLSRGPVAAAWLLFVLAACVVARIRRKDGAKLIWRPRLGPYAAALGLIAFILAGTLAAGLLYPPSNWDSMTYHLPRVMHWADQRSIEFYPTGIWRQNLTQPLAEYGILHLFLLGGDRAGEAAAFLVQWTSFGAAIACAPLIAGELGLNRRVRIASAIAAATIPMAILQSSGTQNDVVAGSLLMATAWLLLRLRRRMRSADVAMCGLALGLALLAKGTSHLFIAGLGSALGAAALIPFLRDIRTLARRFVALMGMLVVALAINGPYIWRCASLARTAGGVEGSVVFSRDYSAAAIGAGVVRNVALHCATPLRSVNEAILHGLERALGSQAENPRTTYPGTTLRVARSLHEDTSGNLIHLGIGAIGLAMALLALARGRPRVRMNVWWYVLGLACSGLLFCVLLRWQPWGSRLHTPLFLLASPLLAIVAAPGLDAGRVRRWIGCLSLAAMIVYCIPFVVYNVSRPLASRMWMTADRNAEMFFNRPEVLDDYRGAVAALRTAGAHEAGLVLDEDDWEYPLWWMTAHQGSPMAFRHVGVTNSSRVLEPSAAPPEYIIATAKIAGWEHVAEYEQLFGSPTIGVYHRRK